MNTQNSVSPLIETGLIGWSTTFGTGRVRSISKALTAAREIKPAKNRQIKSYKNNPSLRWSMLMTRDKIASAFGPAKQSIDWANSAINEAHVIAEDFFASNPAEMVVEVDPQSREKVLKIKMTKALPSSLNRKATEALNNARHSFDQAMFAAQNVLSGGRDSKINYPWAENPVDLEKRFKGKKIDERLWDTISSHEPFPRSDRYSGGDDLTRAVATLANRKHDVGLSVDFDIAAVRYPDVMGIVVMKLELYRPQWDPVKNEAVVARWIGQAEVHGDCNFRFQIMFKDAGFTEPVNAPTALRIFASKANAVVESLEARCVELLSR